MGAADEHERTMVFADIALEQIKALRQPASPLNYELWYTYATGHKPKLNQLLNDTLARKGHLSAADLEQIHASFVGPRPSSDQIETVGASVLDEIAQVMAKLGDAAGSTTTYSASLADASKQLGLAKDGEGLRPIIERLVRATGEMQKTNQALEASLKASTSEIRTLHESLDAARAEAMTDALTGLGNRKHFDQVIASVISGAEGRPPFSLLMIDIDHFKAFNDSFGHLTGDQVLRLVATTIKNNTRSQDLAFRYGGEEFVILLPNAALKEAFGIADHVRRQVMNKDLMKRSTGEHLGRVSISVGVAVHRRSESAQQLIGRADECLYAAKRQGRNRVVAEADPDPATVRNQVA